MCDSMKAKNKMHLQVEQHGDKSESATVKAVDNDLSKLYCVKRGETDV